jgi:ketosteroid isomerase-like protein
VSQAHIALVGDAFRAFTSRGTETALSFFSPDCVWYTTDRWVDGSAYRGHDGMRTLFAAFTENFDDFRFDVHDIRDTQDGVVALVHMIGRIKGSESPISQPIGLVVSDFHDERFGEVHAFASWREALKAVGLEE